MDEELYNYDLFTVSAASLKQLKHCGEEENTLLVTHVRVLTKQCLLVAHVLNHVLDLVVGL